MPLDIPSDELQWRAGAFENLGEFHEALNLYLGYLRDHPRSAFALNNIAALRLQMRQPAEAAEAALKAVSLRSSYVKAWNNLGTAKAMLGDTRGARTAFDKVLALDPSNPIAEKNRASLSKQESGRRVRLVGEGVGGARRDIPFSSIPWRPTAAGAPVEVVVQEDEWRCSCCQRDLNYIERCAEREPAYRSHLMGFRCSECVNYVCFDCWWAGNEGAQVTGKWLCPQCHETPRNIE